MSATCQGCGRVFRTGRALRAHRGVTLACRPVRLVPTHLSPAMIDALISGYSGTSAYADGSATRPMAADLRTIRALERRQLVRWIDWEHNGYTTRHPVLNLAGRHEARRLINERNGESA